MQDGVDGVVEEVAVVADHQDGVRIGLDEIFEPERAFEVEIVGRLVEQQHFGRGEQHGGERDAHAPAAGELAAGAGLRLLVEAEARQNARPRERARNGRRCR